MRALAPRQIHTMPSSTFAELAGLRATIDDVSFNPDLEAPEDRPHPFVYSITIHNDSGETVTIKGRKWIVTGEDAQRVVVEGDGVIGKFPCLRSGECFSYKSYHVVGCDSHAEGAFFGVTESGEPVYTPIPLFKMRVPRG